MFIQYRRRLMKKMLVSMFLIAALLASCAPAPTAAPSTQAPAPATTEAAAPAASGEPIKIGGTYNLTGDMASLDVPAANGSKLAVKEINAAGGVLGRQIDYILYDGKTDSATNANIATQLVSSDKVVAIVGNTDSDSALAIGPIAQKAGIPYLTSGATSPKLPDQVGNMMFLEPFGDNVQAAAGAEFAYNKLNAKTCWLLWDKGTEYTTLLAKYFKERYTELGGQILLEDTYTQGDTDFSAQITRLKALNPQPDFLYAAALQASDAGALAKQIRDAGITLPLMGGDGYDGPELVGVGGQAAENVYFTTHAMMDPVNGTDKVKAFIKAYNAEYGHDPESAFAALGYDAIYLMADAIKRAGSTDPAAIRDALANTKGFEGVTGTITYNPPSRIPQKTVAIIKIVNGKYTLAAEVVPEKVPAP
jgi:branched-chain amino acid transport system substrate-binding protein